MHSMAGHVPDSIKVHGEEKAIAMDLGFSKLEYTDIIYAMTGNLMFIK